MPIPHFGMILTIPAFHRLADRLRAAEVDWVIEPRERFEGKVGEQWTICVGGYPEVVLAEFANDAAPDVFMSCDDEAISAEGRGDGQLYVSAPSQVSLACIGIDLAILLHDDGPLNAARPYDEDSLERMESLGLLGAEALGRVYYAVCLVELGLAAEARTHVERAGEIARRVGGQDSVDAVRIGIALLDGQVLPPAEVAESVSMLARLAARAHAVQQG